MAEEGARPVGQGPGGSPGEQTGRRNFGDHKFCRDGVWELRIDQGAGYRVYYAMASGVVVLLLCGGDKGTQDADIERAVGYWKDWQRRH